jgi:hypothetical protein
VDEVSVKVKDELIKFFKSGDSFGGSSVVVDDSLRKPGAQILGTFIALLILASHQHNPISIS